MWYIIPLIICLLGGMFIPNIVDKNDCEERLIYSILVILPLVNIVISVVCIVYTIAYILELEKKYEVVVITQNVDTLHEQAGSTNVIHLHGNLNEVRAVDNNNLIFTYPYEGITPNTEIEGHKIRPHIVLFGENVPMIGIAAEELTDADICVVVGTSFNVYPAADLIQYVPYGNPIYYIDPNPAPTPEYPDIEVIKATATEGMKQLIQKL